jgi:hypothetical protein
MPVKSDPDTETAGEVGASPPADYCPGRTEWCSDPEDPFYAPVEERPYICDPNAPPSTADMRRLWAGELRINRVVRGPKGGYIWAPPLENSGSLRMLRPTSPDEIVVDPADHLHSSAWRHLLRRRWAQRQVEAARQMRANELAQPRCSICGVVVQTSTPPHYSPWARGGRLCPAHIAAVDLDGALEERARYQAEIDRYRKEAAG